MNRSIERNGHVSLSIAVGINEYRRMTGLGFKPDFRSLSRKIIGSNKIEFSFDDLAEVNPVMFLV